MTLEWAIESIEEYLVAKEIGIDRVELSAALDLGGLTPSIGLIKQCINLNGPDIHVLIRPRSGDFYYSLGEQQVIINEIIEISSLGIHGIVVGALTADANIDLEFLNKIISNTKASNLAITFHRAFDFVSEPIVACQQLIDLGFDRILTSGQASTALEGIDVIKDLVQHAQNNIEIMAGSGVHAGNALRLLEIGVNALHCTARIPTSNNYSFGMGKHYIPDKEKVMKLLEVINSYKRT